MCGIAGLWTDRNVEHAVLRRMAAALDHRGPDDSGTWLDAGAGIGFAHTRLSILDLSAAGHQPMASASGRFVLIYNGETYNHLDLRAELETLGIGGWRGHSDTETLLAAIEQWSLAGTLERATGMFALALWDRERRTLSLARDRMGEKPLYYGWAGGQFCFTSELKALRPIPGFHAEIDRQSLDCLVRYSYVPAPRSIYRGLFKLLPGTIAEITAEARGSVPEAFAGQAGSYAGLSLTPFWSLADHAAHEAIENEDEAAAELERLLIRSIQRQSIADVPVGTFLSGGYDSSTIAALQQAHSQSQVKTFTIGFDEAGFDEAPHARAVAAHLGTDHHEMRVSAADALAVIPGLSSIYDEPFADSSQIPTHLLSKLARTHVKVALSGDGGDELFGGYNRYIAFNSSRRALARVPSPVRAAIAGVLTSIGSDRIDRIGHLSRLDRKFPQIGQKSQKLARLIGAGAKLDQLYPLLLSQWGPEARPVAGLDEPCASARPTPIAGLDDVSQMMAWDMLGYLPDDILCKVDRASMAASLETRAPFLDHEVVELALRIPPVMKIRPDGGKHILRRILYDYVPRDLVDRPKAGFAIPLGQWLRGPLRDWAEALLAEDRLRGDGNFDIRTIRAHWQTHLSGKRDYSTAIWPVLMFQSWLDSQGTGAAAAPARRVA